jgi:hypothetical protein
MRIRWAGDGSDRTFLGKSEIGEQRSESGMEFESFISTGLLRYGVYGYTRSSIDADDSKNGRSPGNH